MITLRDHMGGEPAPRLAPAGQIAAGLKSAPDRAAAKQRQQAERIALWAAQKPRPGLADCTILHDADDDGA
jgi:hypothetical protein